EDGIRDFHVTGVQTCALPIFTSCTNTSNPTLLLGAGLVAKKAVEKGLKVPAYVKTSLAPGSRVVTEYLKNAGLLPSLEALGFQEIGRASCRDRGTTPRGAVAR